MKRLPSLLLSLVLSLALLVPVFAADACTEVSYTAFTCGEEMHFTEHYCRNGDNPRRKRGRMRRQPSGRGCADPNGRKHRRWQDEHRLVPLFTS